MDAMTPRPPLPDSGCQLLERFGDKAGQHGPLASTRAKLSGRISRDANLRLCEIARLNGLKAPQLQGMALEAFSHIRPGELYPTLAELAGQRKP